jgi:hypothetical protein
VDGSLQQGARKEFVGERRIERNVGKRFFERIVVGERFQRLISAVNQQTFA